MTIHLFVEAMTGRLPLVWTACGEPVNGYDATTRHALVNCKGCRKVMEREAKAREVKP